MSFCNLCSQGQQASHNVADGIESEAKHGSTDGDESETGDALVRVRKGKQVLPDVSSNVDESEVKMAETGAVYDSEASGSLSHC